MTAALIVVGILVTLLLAAGLAAWFARPRGWK